MKKIQLFFCVAGVLSSIINASATIKDNPGEIQEKPLGVRILEVQKRVAAEKKAAVIIQCFSRQKVAQELLKRKHLERQEVLAKASMAIQAYWRSKIDVREALFKLNEEKRTSLVKDQEEILQLKKIVESMKSQGASHELQKEILGVEKDLIKASKGVELKESQYKQWQALRDYVFAKKSGGKKIASVVSVQKIDRHFSWGQEPFFHDEKMHFPFRKEVLKGWNGIPVECISTMRFCTKMTGRYEEEDWRSGGIILKEKAKVNPLIIYREISGKLIPQVVFEGEWKFV